MMRIPKNSDSCSNNNRTLVPMLFGQESERRDVSGLEVIYCPNRVKI